MSTENAIAQKGNYATVNGLKMYYEIHGSGSPLVLIHGGGSTIYTSFSKVLPLFAKHHQVIAVELQAHGHTADRGVPTSFEQDADDVAALLQQLHIDSADILGFSNGANTAMQIAIRHPKVVRRLVPVSGMYKRSGIPDGFWEFMKQGTIEQMPQPLKDAFLDINPDPKALQIMFERDSKRMIDFKDWKDSDLQSIKASTFIIANDKDVMTPEHTVTMYRLIPNARLAILPGVHGDCIGEIMTTIPDSKQPMLLVEMVEEFLR